MPLDITIDATQEVDLTAVPVDAKEQEVASEEPVSFNLQSGDVSVIPLSPTSATLRSGAPGDSVIQLSTPDGDPVDIVTVHVLVPPATHFATTVSAPRLKP